MAQHWENGLTILSHNYMNQNTVFIACVTHKQQIQYCCLDVCMYECANIYPIKFD